MVSRFHDPDEDWSWTAVAKASNDGVPFTDNYWSWIYDPQKPLHDVLRYYALDFAQEDYTGQFWDIMNRISAEDSKHGSQDSPLVIGAIPSDFESDVRAAWKSAKAINLHFRCKILRVNRSSLLPCPYTLTLSSKNETNPSSSNSIVIEKANIDDIQDILDVCEVPDSALSRRKYLESMLQHPHWPTLCVRDPTTVKVVAFCLLHRDGRVLGALAVHPQHRRKGYARALLHAVCVESWQLPQKNSNAHGQYLYGITKHDNHGSVGAMESLGFECMDGIFDFWGRNSLA